jgi:hypothetical protein
MKRYDPATKAAIVEAASAARKAGRSWSEAFQAAQAAGYGGSQHGLEQMVRKAGGRKPGRRGRPPGSKNKPRGAVGGEFPSIGAMIEKTVQERVRAALDRAIAALKNELG